MDLLQLLILLTITGICGAFAVLALGFSPRGVVTQLFAVIAGTLGAALGNLVKDRLGIRDLFAIKVGTVRIDIILTVLGSIAIVGLLMGLQLLIGRLEQRSTATTQPPETGSGRLGR